MKEHLFEMGSLPPNPRDFSLSRQDSWAARARSTRSRGIPAAESALGFHPWRALSSVQVPHSSKKDCVEMDSLKLSSKPKSINDVAGLKC
jgi:hypothetical protein